MTTLDNLVIMSKWTKPSAEALLLRIAAGAPEGKQDLKRQRIIEAATALFIEQGYRKTSLDEIARRAGVAKGTLYLYAKGKAELLMQAIAVVFLAQFYQQDLTLAQQASIVITAVVAAIGSPNTRLSGKRRMFEPIDRTVEMAISSLQGWQ